MIKHIVMWKLKDFSEGADREENARKIKEKLEALIPIIKEVKKLEVGINFEKSDMAYDVVLYSEFENERELDTYQNHPEHQNVVQFIVKVKERRVVVDYRV